MADRNSTTPELEDEVERFFERGAYPSLDDFLNRFVDEFDARCRLHNGRLVSDPLGIAIATAAGKLYLAEGFSGQLTRLANLDAIEHARYRDLLLSILQLGEDPAGKLAAYIKALLDCFTPLLRALPPPAFALSDDAEPEQAVTVPLIDLVRAPGSVVEEIQYPIFRSETFFRELRQTITANGDAITAEAGKIIMPSDYRGEPQDVVRAYLAGTPLFPIFGARVPFVPPEADRGEHTAIVAGAGWGKTQLLQSMIAHDLQRDDPPAMVVIDSTGAMVHRIQRLAIFNSRLKDRLVIIDPELDPVPALNPFDVSNPRFSSYAATVREQMQGEIIDLFNYVFSTVNNPLTTRMQTAFAFMVRLLLSVPGANIHTLLQLLDDDPPKGNYEQAAFKPHIDLADPTAQHFFKAQYYTGRDGGLREQIRARVFDILRVPAFERMFSSVNRLDFFTELNRGNIVLVNTSEALLKDSSATFGRYIIARVMAAAFERASILPEKRRQAFLIVDEAAPYFDETFEKLLNRVRQFKLGAVIAFQNLEQASEKLRSTIASSTAIKYAGGTGYNDARWLAREMRIDPEFILAQKRDGVRPPKWTQFACHVRAFTDRAVSLTVPFYTLENMPKMSDAEHAQLLERNRARVAAPANVPERMLPAPPPEAAPIDPTTAALAEAYADLSDAIGRSDWTRASELKDRIIPELERKSRPPEPRPAPASPETPRRAATGRDEPFEEGTTDWR